VRRASRVWVGLDRDQRLAGVAALILLLTLFLPWYDVSIPRGNRFIDDTASGFGSADFTLASVVLVALGVLALLWARGENRGFHLPFGDGVVIMAGGAWTCLLIFFRIISHPDLGGANARVGVQWGFVIALLAAFFLIYTGARLRVANRPEPPLPAADDRGFETGDDPDGGPVRPPRPALPARPARRPSAAREQAWLAVEPLVEDEEREPEPPRATRREGPSRAPARDDAQPPARPRRELDAADAPGEDPTEIVPRRRRPRPPDETSPTDQLSFDESETQR
jgi:hypothetical protein